MKPLVESTFKPLVDILIPSYQNLTYLNRCLDSIQKFTTGDYRITIINNGNHVMKFEGANVSHHQSLIADHNMRWTDAINWAATKTSAPYVLMMNDDTQVLDHDCGWLYRMLQPFKNDKVAAVGPTSNYAMGLQGITAMEAFPSNFQKFTAPFLSGFCMMLRRSTMDEVGWLDEDFQDGAEDVELSIRLRMAGYELVVCRDVFIYHVGSVTANREHGEWWNSNEYSIEQRMKVMRKFGVRKFNEMTTPQIQGVLEEDKGRSLIKGYIKPGMTGLDLGCGPHKIVDEATGVDVITGMIQYGRYAGKVSTADVTHDISKPLPFADNSQDYVCCSHIIEHIADPLMLLDEIYRVLKPEGRLLVTMPSQNLIDVIPLDPTHLVAYTPTSFQRLLKRATDFLVMKCEDCKPGYNMLCVAEKPEFKDNLFSVTDGEYTSETPTFF